MPDDHAEVCWLRADGTRVVPEPNARLRVIDRAFIHGDVVARAANALADARGAAPEDVARTLAELRATQDAVAKSLLDTEDAVLWLQKLEWLELQARFPYTGPHTTAFAR